MPHWNRTRAARWWPVAAVALLAAAGVALFSCSPIGVSVQTPKDRPMPIDMQNQQLPVAMTQPVPVQMLEPVPVSLAGPITIQLQLPGATYEGVYVSKELMDRVEIGQTTDDWILAVIGEPTHRTTLRDGTEIWRWDYRPTESSPLVSLLGGGGKEQPTPMPVTAYVRLRDGVVIEKWRS